MKPLAIATLLWLGSVLCSEAQSTAAPTARSGIEVVLLGTGYPRESAFGYKFESAGKIVVISGDTAPS